MTILILLLIDAVSVFQNNRTVAEMCQCVDKLVLEKMNLDSGIRAEVSLILKRTLIFRVLVSGKKERSCVRLHHHLPTTIISSCLRLQLLHHVIIVLLPICQRIVNCCYIDFLSFNLQFYTNSRTLWRRSTKVTVIFQLCSMCIVQIAMKNLTFLKGST